MSQVNYAPYFYNGMLYIPRETAKLIHSEGLDTQVTIDATRGLRLDDDSQKVSQLHFQLQELITGLDDESVIKSQLTTPEVAFMFSSIEESEELVQV